MGEILKEVLKYLPKDIISEATFEGSNIVLYTKDKDFFLDNNGSIKQIVDDIKKRVELRPDPVICMELEKAEKKIKSILPAEAGADNIIFDPQRSMVIIEAEKPGLAIGKQGSILREIRAETLWVPLIRRTPAIRSKLIENIREVLYQNNDYRKKFLKSVGHRIYDGWKRGKKNEWVRLSFLGGAREVGRSCILLQTPESRVLLDCGINVASERDAYPFLDAPEFKIEELDAVIISHAHLDHSGFVPYLYKFGYKGPVYCTEPTRDVSALLQLDLVKIQRGEGKEPIFTSEEIREFVKHSITLEYNEVSDITPDIRITLYNAGHILGSSMVHMHIGNGLHNFLYSADMKFGRTQLLEPAITDFPRLETLMIESTYGGRDNVLPSRVECEKEMAEILKKTIKDKGKILIPVLGVGRAQEVMLVVENLIRTGKVDNIPVYIDGMVWDVTAIHTAYPEFLNNFVRNQIFHKDSNPFMSDIFKRVGSPKERKEVIENTGACIILATSGMLMGGPSVEYLKSLSSGKKHSLIFVSYQGEGSLGRRIQRGEREISFGVGHKQEVMKINMDIHTIEGFSGHSDRKELMSFVYKCSPKPKKVIINHGENSRCLDLASSIHKTNRIETNAPRVLEALRLR
ncbi:beta-CASP ribonuclease aCPSF1 [Candidatus Woesearchaeota archaeon]|nr:beta-CASP ribonuclease aCPSF1 [Candidatus Woesearchaeota archaeon]